jgi:hypothetical protein
MTLRPALQALVYAALAALIGLAIGHAMFTMPKMLAAQAVADAMGAGIKRLALLAAMYVPTVLLYGGVVLWATKALRWRSLWAFVTLGLLPLAGYVLHALMQAGAQPGWQGNALFHVIPSLLASIALWLGTVRE